MLVGAAVAGALGAFGGGRSIAGGGAGGDAAPLAAVVVTAGIGTGTATVGCPAVAVACAASAAGARLRSTPRTTSMIAITPIITVVSTTWSRCAGVARNVDWKASSDPKGASAEGGGGVVVKAPSAGATSSPVATKANGVGIA